jgi:transcriptional regulator with XRE-family HTH domain
MASDREEVEAILSVFAGRSKSLREQAELTPFELAARCFITSELLYRYERGERAPRLIVLRSLAHAIGASVGDLTDGLPTATRVAGRTRTPKLVGGYSGIGRGGILDSLELPASYARELVSYMQATGELVATGDGMYPGTIQDVTGRGGG